METKLPKYNAIYLLQTVHSFGTMNEHKHSAICGFPGWKTIKRTYSFIPLLLKCKTRENSLREPKCFELHLLITVSGVQETEFASAIIMFLGYSVASHAGVFRGARSSSLPKLLVLFFSTFFNEMRLKLYEH